MKRIVSDGAAPTRQVWELARSGHLRAADDGAIPLADRAIAVSQASGDDYVIVQILNILGAVYFDRATSKLNLPHARSHLSSLDPHDAGPMEEDAREALRYFERARSV